MYILCFVVHVIQISPLRDSKNQITVIKFDKKVILFCFCFGYCVFYVEFVLAFQTIHTFIFIL